jgi:MFS family permease
VCCFIKDPYTFFIVFGINIGQVSVFGSYVPVWIAWELSDEKYKGMLAGFSCSAYMLGPFVFGLIFTLTANYDNKSPMTVGNTTEVLFDEDIISRVPFSLYVFTAFSFVLGISMCVLLYNKNSSFKEKVHLSTISAHDLIKQKNFWHIFSLLFFKIFYYHYLLNVYKMLGLYYDHEDFSMSAISAIGFISAALIRILIGHILDTYCWKKVTIAAILIELFFCLTFPLTFSNVYLYGLWFTLSFSLSSSSFLMIWILTQKLYPKDRWVIGLISLSLIFDMFLVNIFQGFVTPVIFM